MPNYTNDIKTIPNNISLFNSIAASRKPLKLNIPPQHTTMKHKSPKFTAATIMEPQQQQQQHDNDELDSTNFNSNSDLCQQLMNRYAASSASQHRHLIATAAAMRSIILSESLPLTPTAYFAASISAIANAPDTLDSDEVGALTAFMGIVLSVVPTGGIGTKKAVDAIEVLVDLVKKGGGLVSAAGVRSVVKCLGVLVAFCDLEDWDSVKLGLETLLKFAVDKRPKVRKCSQVCVETVFKSFQDSIVLTEASKCVMSFVEKYMHVALEISSLRAKNESNDEGLSKPEHLEVLHVLNFLSLIVPLLSSEVSAHIFSEVQKLMTSHFSPLTRHTFKITEVLFRLSGEELIVSEIESTLLSLASYVSLGVKTPLDTLIPAANLLKSAFEKLHAKKPRSSIENLPSVFGSILGILSFDVSSAEQASSILKELINNYIDEQFRASIIKFEDDVEDNIEIRAIKSTCAILENAVETSDGSPNEHLLDLLSVLLLQLGNISYNFMEGIILKLAKSTILAGEDLSATKHLQTCMGSAVTAMGPDKILQLLPISFNPEDFTCSNVWLIPILKSHAIGGAMGYYIEHIVPLAKSFQRASSKVKKSSGGKDLQVHAHGLWDLLPAFCNHPTDTYKNIDSLVKLLVNTMRKKSFMHKNIAVSVQEIVNQNKEALRSEGAEKIKTSVVKDSTLKVRDVHCYSKKIAKRNIKALTLCSEELLQALADLFLHSPPVKRSYLKDAIGCLASISDSATNKKILMSSLEKYHLVNDNGEFKSLSSNPLVSTDEKKSSLSGEEKDLKRCVIVELASCLVEGAKEDLISLIYDFVKDIFQTTDGIKHKEAYHTLTRILKEHTWFYSSRLIEVIDLLLDLKSPEDTPSLKSRFTTFHILVVNIVQGSSEEENTKAFLILNEIILRLKDSNEESRKVAYDTLLMIGSSLRNPSDASSDSPYCKLVKMIMGYLSGSSPQIKSGAVSALSLLVFQDPLTCLSESDLLPTMLHLLHNKSIEVIKAVLGFMKVLVSCLPAKDLQSLLAEIMKAILPWSSVSRNHFRSKVIVIVEIMTRKCGPGAVKFNAPEKYNGFIQTVLENRHGKNNTKETSTATIEPTPTDSSSKGWQNKAMDKGFRKPYGNDESFASRKRKRDGNPTFRSNGPHNPAGNGKKWNGNDQKQAKGDSPHRFGDDKKRGFNKESNAFTHRKNGLYKGEMSSP